MILLFYYACSCLQEKTFHIVCQLMVSRIQLLQYFHVLRLIKCFEGCCIILFNTIVDCHLILILLETCQGLFRRTPGPAPSMAPARALRNDLEVEWLRPVDSRATKSTLPARRWSKLSHKNQLHLLQLRLRHFLQSTPKRSLIISRSLLKSCETLHKLPSFYCSFDCQKLVI